MYQSLPSNTNSSKSQFIRPGLCFQSPANSSKADWYDPDLHCDLNSPVYMELNLAVNTQLDGPEANLPKQPDSFIVQLCCGNDCQEAIRFEGTLPRASHVLFWKTNPELTGDFSI